MLKRVGRTMATIAALSALVMVSQAGAVDKLVVNNSGGSAVFKVDDAGTLTGSTYYFVPSTKKFGFGTMNPQTSLHLSENQANFDRGLTIGQHGDVGSAAIINIKKSRGQESAPTAVINTDVIAAIHGQAYDGAQYQVPLSIRLQVDGPVTTGSVPSAMSFMTGSDTNKPERLRINYLGIVGIGSSFSQTNQPTVSGTGKLHMNADTFRLDTPRTPSSSSAACNQGEISWDTNYIYVCVATNTWKRTALTGGW